MAFHRGAARRLATGKRLASGRLSAAINSFETQIKPLGYFPLFDRAINCQRRGALRQDKPRDHSIHRSIRTRRLRPATLDRGDPEEINLPRLCALSLNTGSTSDNASAKIFFLFRFSFFFFFFFLFRPFNFRTRDRR